MKIFNRILKAIIRRTRDDMTPEQTASVLDQAARERNEPLQWRMSVVDLLKALGLDSSLEARKEMAEELGYDGPMDGSEKMNTWLHKRVVEAVSDYDIELPPAPAE